ncbi:MAG: FkbM family methyltransferase [Phycisphaerales bacterium]|jgi:FkbM family methyltransferase|nr:FkbM family methyltransferase [Phycisphaerales bacterium]
MEPMRARARRGIKRWIGRAAGVFGLHVERRAAVPFGVDWLADLAAISETPVERVMDVGANIGQTARALRRAFPDAEIHCFEPVPATYAILARATQGDARIRCENIGLSNRAGTLWMTAEPGAGTNRIVSGPENGGQISVPVESLDAYCARQGIERVDVLKMDVEGAELGVLAGAVGTLRDRGVRFVLSECEFRLRADEPHAPFSELHAFLAAHGFVVVSFYTGGVDALGWRWGNVLYRRAGSTDANRVRVSPYA